ncbi:MAG: NTP transferase domain-containing protein [Candidatus Eisenbacteria bacterium]|nr:NTP transferase domain-containing protein [Candidatus Eisenbacteria bacterium]
MSLAPKDFIAIIPAAGIGTRLRPHTHTLPKALINVAGRPILAHILDALIQQGIKRYVLVVGYMGDRIREYIDERYEIDVEFVEQETRRGLGHAIYMTKDIVGSHPSLIVLGDTIVQTDYAAYLNPNEIVIGVKEVEDPRRFGIVEIADGYVQHLVEKPEQPTSNLAIVGIYGIRHTDRLFKALGGLIEDGKTTKGEFQLTDALEKMMQDGAKMTVQLVSGWFDCGKPETLLQTNRHLLEGITPPIPRPGVVFVPPVFVDSKAVVEQSILGPYVSVARGAIVRGSILRDSIVTENATVEDIILENSVIGENAVVQGTCQSLNVGDSSEIRPS